MHAACRSIRPQACLQRDDYQDQMWWTTFDPDNRFVAYELERRWNDKLIEVHRLEEELEAFDRRRQVTSSEEERAHLVRLGADLELAWSHPAATVETRKRIVRAVPHEIVVRIEDGCIAAVLHWRVR